MRLFSYNPIDCRWHAVYHCSVISVLFLAVDTLLTTKIVPYNWHYWTESFQHPRSALCHWWQWYCRCMGTAMSKLGAFRRFYLRKVKPMHCVISFFTCLCFVEISYWLTDLPLSKKLPECVSTSHMSSQSTATTTRTKSTKTILCSFLPEASFGLWVYCRCLRLCVCVCECSCVCASNRACPCDNVHLFKLESPNSDQKSKTTFFAIFNAWGLINLYLKVNISLHLVSQPT